MQGDCAGMGIQKQDAGIDDVADADHGLDLAALLRPARKRLGGRAHARTVKLGGYWIEKREGSSAHDLAVDGTRQKSTWESL